VTVRLSIRTAIWRAHVAQVAGAVDGLVPVVKGNGYGFGRAWLATVAAELSDTIAVGTIHELDAVPAGVTAVVLTPTLAPPPDDAPVLTVGRQEHVDALAGWSGRVLVKLGSTSRPTTSSARHATPDWTCSVSASIPLSTRRPATGRRRWPACWPVSTPTSPSGSAT
jgi:hypothetical protein